MDNTGNVDLTNVVVTDSLGNTFTAADIAVGGKAVFTDAYTTVQGDIDSGNDLVNTATIASNDQNVAGSSSATTDIDQDPALLFTKTAATTPQFSANDPANTADQAGQVISYALTVTNTGNETLTNVVVHDSDGKTFTVDSLGVGVSKTFADSYTVQQSDIDGGKAVADSATVSDSQGVSATASASTSVDQHHSLSIAKSVISVVDPNYTDGKVHDAGDVINYDIHITNTGNETLSSINVLDPLTGLTKTVSLNPGASTDTSTSYTVTQSDIDNHGHVTGSGNVTNTATASDSLGDTGQSSASVGVVNDFTTAASKALTAGFWANHMSDWDGVAGNDAKASQLVSAGTLSQKALTGDLLPNSGWDGDITDPTNPYYHKVGVLLGDANGDGKTDNGEHTLFIPLAAAQSIISQSTSGDAHIIMLNQAIATQLNIDNGVKEPSDVIGQAVQWLTGAGNIDANHDGILQTGSGTNFEFNTAKNALTTAALSTSSTAWQTYNNDPLVNVKADGEGIKNALAAFNQGQLVTQGNDVGWSNGTSVVDVHTNTQDHFWLTLHQVGGITGVA